MVMKGCSTFPRAQELVPHQRIQFSELHWTFVWGGGLTWLIQQLDDYIEKYGGLITAIRKDTDNMMANRTTITGKQKWEEKQFYGRFKRLINLSHEKTWTWLRKGNLKREIESLLISAQNNDKRTNHIKARIDKTQQNSKCRLCGDRDETINHIISECSKLAQKE